MAKRTQNELLELLDDLNEVIYLRTNELYVNTLGTTEEVANAQVKLTKLLDAQKRLCKLIDDPDAVIESLCRTPIEMSAPTYHLSSELLKRIGEYLIDLDGMEKFCYVTGIRTSANHIVPTSIIKPKMSKRSVSFAQGDDDSITEHLMYLSDFGHTVFLQCHRHPGRGKNSTHPSSIDLNNHKLWEVYYPTIGIIFVEDGYFRFFSAKKNFKVEIHGKGVKKVDRTVYKFDN